LLKQPSAQVAPKLELELEDYTYRDSFVRHSSLRGRATILVVTIITWGINGCDRLLAAGKV